LFDHHHLSESELTHAIFTIEHASRSTAHLPPLSVDLGRPISARHLISPLSPTQSTSLLSLSLSLCLGALSIISAPALNHSLSVTDLRIIFLRILQIDLVQFEIASSTFLIRSFNQRSTRSQSPLLSRSPVFL
jgi:hypothetical protein